jgi:hypothetical protein
MIQLFVQNGNKIDTGGAQDRERETSAQNYSCQKLHIFMTLLLYVHFHVIQIDCLLSQRIFLLRSSYYTMQIIVTQNEEIPLIYSIQVQFNMFTFQTI